MVLNFRKLSVKWAVLGQFYDENQTSTKYVESSLMTYLDESSILSDSTKQVTGNR